MTDTGMLGRLSAALAEIRRDSSGGAFDDNYSLIAEIHSDSRELLPVLHEAISSDTNPEALVFALDALKKLDADLISFVPALARCLPTDHSDVRVVAARLLARIGSNAREAIPALVRLVKDPRAYVSTRLVAIWALRRVVGTWHRTIAELRLAR